MRNFTFVFFFILLGDLLARAMQPDWQIMEYVFKPLLMISLGEYFISSIILRGVRQNQFVLAAIVFSLLGDVFLMLEGYFIHGLGAFLIAHLFYIYAFQSEASRFFSKKKLFIPTILVLVYGYFLLMQVLPNVALPLKVPITVYAIAILLMLLTTLHRWGNVSVISFNYVIIGATLFVISDSLIAISKFVTSFPMDGVLIMATYGIGQYLIVEGFLKNVNASSIDN